MMAAPGQGQPATGPALHDIHVPAMSWWPPAPGWWISALLLVMLVMIGIWWWRRRLRRHVLEQALLAEVEALVRRYRAHPQSLAAGLHQLLRRAALRYAPHAGQCRADDWREVLAMVSPDAEQLDVLMSLESAMYRAHAPFDVDQAIHATRCWLLLAWRFRPPNAPRASRFASSASAESGHA